MYMAGYGKPGTAATGPQDPDYYKRAGSNIADSFGGDLGVLTVESQYWMAQFGVIDPAPPEWHSAPGDSGAGWFADIDGRSQIVGVNLFGWGGDNVGSSSGALIDL